MCASAANQRTQGIMLLSSRQNRPPEAVSLSSQPCDRIAGALANLGYRVCDQTVGNVLQRYGLQPAPERKRTTIWSAFIRTHLALPAGTDCVTAEVRTPRDR
jgi:hypothetical protein